MTHPKLKRPDPASCPGISQAHRDAERLVEYLIENNGHVDATNEEIARHLNLLQRAQSGVYLLDRGRFTRARQHVNDGRNIEGGPCCGFNVNYRRSGPRSLLALIDPRGGIGPHAIATAAAVAGFASRERQRHTESRRMIVQLEDLADYALARQDKHGYRTCQSAILDLDRDGTIHPDTTGALNEWIQRVFPEGDLTR